MKKILESFTHKTIQEFARLARKMIIDKNSIEDLVKFAKDKKEEYAKDMFEEIPATEVFPKTIKAVGKFVPPKNSPKPKLESEPVKSKFIIPGELVKMEGVVCSKCGSELFITAVCCSNPLKKKGFLRKTICEKCGIEFGQK